MILYNGDMLVEMDKIPDKSVDMILADLPYGTTACKWDTIIPFEPLWEQYNRIIKDNGVIALFGSQPFTTLLINSNIKDFKEELIWLKNKTPSGLNATTRHLKAHENIIIFSKGKNTYNPQKWLVDKKEFLTQRKTFNDSMQYSELYGNVMRKKNIDDGSRFPLSILSCRVPFNASKTKKYNKNIEIRVHPTQKPVALCEYLIKTYTNEGETVLDNVMGSGTTGVACKKLKRKFIGIELDETYFNIAKDRLNGITASGQTTIFTYL